MLNIRPATSVVLLKEIKPTDAFEHEGEMYVMLDLANSDIEAKTNKFAAVSLDTAIVVAFTGEEEVQKLRVEGQAYVDYAHANN